MLSDKQRKLDNYFMNIAIETAKLSTCASISVGSCLVYDGRIISTGYNGSLSGQPHCTSMFIKGHSDLKNKDSNMRAAHHKYSEINEIHSEMNAILDASKRGTLAKGSTIYTTTKPCFNCTKLCIAAGIIRIVYLTEYDLQANSDTKDLCNNLSIVLEKFKD